MHCPGTLPLQRQLADTAMEVSRDRVTDSLPSYPQVPLHILYFLLYCTPDLCIVVFSVPPQPTTSSPLPWRLCYS